MKMVLTHFSEKKLKFNSSVKYTQPPHNDQYKPNGFWLSDESDDDGWKSWCDSEQFGIERLKHRVQFEIDITGILVIDTHQKVKNFHNKYSVHPNPTFEISKFIDWKKVSKDYSGVVIVPYCYEARLRYMWYYGWDCASGCIWDLTKVKECGK